jgi:hypothetical protein
MVTISTPANNKKVYFHDGNKLRIGKNKGVPAQTIVNILTDIVLNLGAMLIKIYLKFNLYRYRC